jgi:hypothetical protein
MHITSDDPWIKNHGNLSMYIKKGTREFKPIYSGSEALRKGINVEP